MSAPSFYWASHKKHICGERLAWYAESADEGFWARHWARYAHNGYYGYAERLHLEEDELGRLILRHLPKAGRHLEAGCGAGFWVAALANRGFDIEGIENSEELVQLVNSKAPHLRVRCSDALCIDIAEGTYDSYLSFGVVEHRESGPHPFLLEAARVLRPGGTLLVSVPYFGPLRRFRAGLRLYESRLPALPFFQYAFSLEEFRGILSESGFDVLRSYPLAIHRLLVEEVGTYRFLVYSRGGLRLKRLIIKALSGRDGHMILFVARRRT